MEGRPLATRKNQDADDEKALAGYGVPRLVEAAKKYPGGRVDIFCRMPNGKVTKLNQGGYEMLDAPEAWIAERVGQSGSYILRVCDAKGQSRAQATVEVHPALAPPSQTGWPARGTWTAPATPAPAMGLAPGAPPPGYISQREAELQVEMAKLRATQEAMARAPSSSSSVVDKMLEMMLVKLMSEEKKDPLDDVAKVIQLQEALGGPRSDDATTELVRVGGDLAKALLMREKSDDVAKAAKQLPSRSDDDMERLGRILHRSIVRGWSGADTLETVLDAFGQEKVTTWAQDLETVLRDAMKAFPEFGAAYGDDTERAEKWTEGLLSALMDAAKGEG